VSPDDPTAPDAAPAVPPNSRYAGVPVATTRTRDGVEVRYFRRRFLPAPEASRTVVEHVVAPGDRLDLLAERYYGDPLLAWRIADANGAQDPAALTATPGRVLRITPPEGLAGA
jgi:nucleoid-associated protein YgaU